MPCFHHSVAVLPLLFRRSRYPLPFQYTVAVAVAYLFAVYGCNETEFSYVIFTEQRNFTTAERGETATEERQRNGGNRVPSYLVRNNANAKLSLEFRNVA